MTEAVKQNGIKRPESTSVTGKLWDIADRISAALGAPAPRKDVVTAYMAEVPAANEATANTQYARWVTFHGASDYLREARRTATAERSAAKVQEKADAKAKRDQEKLDKANAAAADKLAKEDEEKRVAQAVADEKARVKAEKDAEKAKLAEAKQAEKDAKAKVKAEAKAAKEAADAAAAASKAA